MGDYEDMDGENWPFLQIGDEAPDFDGESQVGSINLHNLIDSAWCVLVFFSRDLEPVGTTEMAYLCKLKEEFDARKVKVVCISPDSKVNHQRWINDTQELQDVKINVPLIADERGDVCRQYGLLRPRDYKATGGKNKFKSLGKMVLPTASTYIVDIDKRIRSITHNAPGIGRNFYETIRQIDALQLSLFHQVSTPCNWMQTEDVFINTDITPDAAQSMFTKGFMEIKSYFRVTPQPDTES